MQPYRDSITGTLSYAAAAADVDDVDYLAMKNSYVESADNYMTVASNVGHGYY